MDYFERVNTIKVQRIYFVKIRDHNISSYSLIAKQIRQFERSNFKDLVRLEKYIRYEK
jgi:hypothetical protein